MMSFDACYVKISVNNSDSDSFCKIKDVNNSFLVYFGYERNQIINMDIGIIQPDFIGRNHKYFVKKY